MSDALEQASLIMVPSGYENGTLGSLKPLDGSGDFTFSRGSDISATRVNEDGYIEKGYENLLLQSNQFDTTWSTYQAILTSGQQGYDSSNDAWLLQSSPSGLLSQSVANSGTQTFSIYAKSGTTDWIQIRFFGGSTTYANFDLNPSTTGSRVGNTSLVIDATTEDVGNGWYRCSFSINNATTYFRVQPMSGDNINPTGGENIYIQDAMLNEGLVAYPYVETTTAPVAGGILEDMPRLDYTDSSCPALLLEPQRTNLFPNSEYFSNAFSFVNSLVSYNDTISPEGNQNAVKYITTGTSFNYANRTIVTQTNEKYALSIFGKKGDTNVLCFTYYDAGIGGNIYFNYDLENGVILNVPTSSPAYFNASITDFGNGWYRCVAIINSQSGGTNSFFQFNLGTNRISPAANSYIYVWGAQLEQDATYPTSYIPTYGTSQTRLKDVCSKTGISSLIGQTEGTLFAEFTPTSGLNTDIVQLAADTALDNGISIGCGVGNIYGSVYTDSSYRFNTGFAQTIPNNTFKVALCYKTNDFTFFVNGVKVASGANSYSPSSPLTRINFNQAFFFGNQVIDYKSVLVFPVKLSDADCITLTTL